MAVSTCTRSVKLVVPRAPEHTDIPQALWTMHVAINAPCRFYEERLVHKRSPGLAASAALCSAASAW
jgi:hypothetical protein